MRSSDGLTRVGGTFNRLLERRGGAEVMAVAKLETVWRDVVGDPLAKQCRPTALESGKLIISVPSPTWNTTLRTMERQILANLQRTVPELGIRSLRLVLGAKRPPEPPPSVEERRDREVRAIQLSAAALRTIEETVATVADDELRAGLTQMMVRQQQLRIWRLAHGWTFDPLTGRTEPPA